MVFAMRRQHLLVRLLDSKLQSLLGLPCSELSLPAEELARLPVGDAPVIIVENRINLLTLPAMAGSLALGGLGNNLAEFQRLPWLNSRTIRYWGDLDVEGLQILARLRHLFPQTLSFLMDMATLEAHRELWTEGKNSQPTSEPAHLQAAELEAFQFCLRTMCGLSKSIFPNPPCWPHVPIGRRSSFSHDLEPIRKPKKPAASTKAAHGFRIGSSGESGSCTWIFWPTRRTLKRSMAIFGLSSQAPSWRLNRQWCQGQATVQPST